MWDKIKDIWTFITKFNELKSELKELQKENDELRKDNEEIKAYQSEYNKTIDSNVFKEIKEMIYEKGLFNALQEQDFRSSYSDDLFSLLSAYSSKVASDPEFKFINSSLDKFKNQIDDNINKLIDILIINSHSDGLIESRSAIPKEWQVDQPEVFEEKTTKANSHSREIIKNYKKLVSTAKEKMLKF